MSRFKLTTPVAFFIFNRPDSTEKVFHEIAKAKPAKLFVIGDGPRANHTGEYKRVADTREIICRVDWDCEVITNFSESNLGCKQRVSSGIDWVFEQVEACFKEKRHLLISLKERKPEFLRMTAGPPQHFLDFARNCCIAIVTTNASA